MKIMNKKDICLNTCVVYTVLSLGKIALEALAQQKFGSVQAQLLVMFLLSALATLVLSQHYRLDILPLWLVAIVQYVALIGFVLLLVWITSFFEPVSEGGYWDMFRSFTIPYIIGALAYYWQLHREIQKANQTLEKLKERRK